MAHSNESRLRDNAQNTGANFNVDLGTPNVVGGTTNDLVTDRGASTIAGTVNVNQLAGFGAGAYRLINYAGALTNNGVAVAGAPAGSLVQAGGGQVNLLVAGANGIGQYWNGAVTTPNGTVNGGTGSWTNAAANTNWTDANGNFAESWASGSGVFAGTAGTVTVNDAIAFQALEFATTGYTVVAGTGTLTATGAGLITTDPNVTATIAAPIAGTVGLTKAGTGTLVLSGANTFTGGTTIGAGTLQLGAGGAAGSIVGNVADSGTLAFDRSDVSTFAGIVSGAGALTQIGTGTTVLTGANTYTGGTTITAGTLQLGNGGTTGSIIGNVADSGTLAFDRSDASTFAGVVSGPGTLAQIGTGTTVLTAANTYTGGTTITAGTLQLGNGGTTGSILGNVADSGTLAFDRSDTSTFAGVVSGAGALTQIGTGTTILTAANTYTGATTVSGGTLLVNGSIAASSGVTLAQGATLGGNGTVASTMVGAGTLAPGPGAGVIGTLTVAGTLAFTNASTYAISVAPMTASLTNVAGGATLAGTVAATFQNGSYLARQYTILTAANVGGTFGALASTNLPAGFAASLAYDANDAYLKLSALNLTQAIGTGGLNQNQRSVAAGLNNAFNNGAALPPAFVTVFGQTGATLANSLSQLSGEGITATQTMAYRESSLFTSTITDQTTFYGDAGGAANSVTLSEAVPGAAPIRELADLPSRGQEPVPPAPRQRTWRTWATGFGGSQNVQGDAALGSNGLNDTLYGGSLGVDYQIAPNYLAGIAVGGSDGSFSLPSLATSGSTTGGHVAFYDLATFGSFYAASSNTFSYYTNQTTRTAIADTERGTFDSHEFRTRLEVGRHVAAYGAVLTPFIALDLAELRSNGFTERSLSGPGLFGLSVQGQDVASVPATVGLRYQQLAALGNGMVFAPSVQLAYVHEFAPERQQIAGFAALPGSTFLIDGARPDRNAAQVKIGGTLAVTPASAIFGSFDSELSGHALFYAGKGGLRYSW